MENNRLKLAGILAGTALLSLALTTTALAEDVTIGVATAQTGGLAPYDQPALAELQFAVDELNAKGGFAGKYPIVMKIKDTRSDTAATVQAAQELVGDKVTILITPCDADPTIAAGQISQPAQIPTMTLCGSTPTIPGAVGDFMFGSYPADNAQATVLANYALGKGYKTAYVLKSPDSSYTLKLPEYFAEVFAKKGGTVLGQGTYAMNQQDFSAEVTKIKSFNPEPDVVMTSAYEPDFPAFIKGLRAAGVTSAVLGSDGIDTATTVGLGAVVDGVVHTTAGYPVPGSALEAFNTRYKEKTGKEVDTVYIANGYEMGLIFDAAIRAAGSIEGPAIRDALKALKDVEGVTGKITFAGTNGMPSRAIALVEVKDGKRSLVELVTPDPAEVPAP
jgi:branched-chain amino acid transport system substrate-binding protein